MLSAGAVAGKNDRANSLRGRWTTATVCLPQSVPCVRSQRKHVFPAVSWWSPVSGPDVARQPAVAARSYIAGKVLRIDGGQPPVIGSRLPVV